MKLVFVLNLFPTYKNIQPMTFKPAYWHYIYILALILLGFQYYSKASLLERTCESLGSINQQLEDDAEIISASAQSMKDAIHRETEMNPNKYRSYWLKLEAADTVVRNTLLYIKYCKNHLKATSSFDKSTIPVLKQFLSNAMNALTNVNDSIHKKAIIKMGHLKSFLENEGYWKRFPKLPNEAILTELSKMQNLVLNDEFIFLNYTMDQVSRSYNTSPVFFRVGIFPNKAALIEGETVKFDVILCSYSVQSDLFTAKINGQKVEIKDGVAHFKSKPNSVGKKVIKAELSMRNPATGQVVTQKGEYQYEVFPKCSRDCQQ
jgi:hypothetical protein